MLGKMKKGMWLVIPAFAIYSASVKAYIDPGTGSAIAGSLWPLIVAFFSAVGAFIVKYFWNPIKSTLLKARNIFK